MSFDEHSCYQCKRKNSIVKILIRSKGCFQKVFLCEECYERYNVYLHGKDSGYIENIFHNMFSNSRNTDPKDSANTSESDRINCPHCQHTLTQVLSSGCFGCLKCVNFFQPQLDRILESSQNPPFHKGMTPTHQKEKYVNYQKLYYLKHLLKESVEAEDFSRARKIKIQVVNLERQLDTTDNAHQKRN